VGQDAIQRGFAWAAAGTNIATNYQIGPGFAATDAELNSEVRRIAADVNERARFTFTGKLRAPLLTIQDTGDLFVPIANAREYGCLAARPEQESSSSNAPFAVFFTAISHKASASARSTAWSNG